jgi:NADP-dependent 3-hydroxy acid dehydrogenase YdfG
VESRFLNLNKEKRIEMSNITDKVVVITGASSGIGESTAKLLAEHGAKVVLGARRSNRIGAVVQEISASGGKAIGFATDVTKRAEAEALIQQAVDSFGRVDVLLNNAGIMPIAPIEALKVDEWDRQKPAMSNIPKSVSTTVAAHANDTVNEVGKRDVTAPVYSTK